MVLVDQVRAMEKIREAILTVHRNTGNQSSSRHPRVPACLAWFRKEADRVLSALRHPEKKEFFRETRRVERFLESRRPEERALVIFAGKKIWSVIPLQTGVENEMHWGKPALAQSFRLLNGHPAVGVLVVDHQAARLFMHRLGEFVLPRISCERENESFLPHSPGMMPLQATALLAATVWGSWRVLIA